MIIFSNSSILASPDKRDLKQVHVVFNKKGDDYDKVISLFLKFSLAQVQMLTLTLNMDETTGPKSLFSKVDGAIRPTSPEVFQMCFSYTLTAKLAPTWNTLGLNYLVNNRDFLTSKGPQNGIKYQIWSSDQTTVVEVKPVKVNLISSDEIYLPGEWIRVLPSLNKAVVEEYCESLPESGSFKCYKDLRRHWKNIHGYRLPEEESPYYTIRFWRGDPLTYPKICVIRNFPIVTPVPKPAEKIVLTMFWSCLKSRIPHFLGIPLMIQMNDEHETFYSKTTLSDTQAISLCTPTQNTYKA